jgi:hypothetical protein
MNCLTDISKTLDDDSTVAKDNDMTPEDKDDKKDIDMNTKRDDDEFDNNEFRQQMLECMKDIKTRLDAMESRRDGLLKTDCSISRRRLGRIIRPHDG